MIIFNSIVKDPSFNSSILLSCTIILYFGCAVRSTVLPTMFYSNKKICICIFFCAARRYLLILHPMNKIPNLLNGVIRAMSIWTFSLHSLVSGSSCPDTHFFFSIAKMTNSWKLNMQCIGCLPKYIDHGVMPCNSTNCLIPLLQMFWDICAHPCCFSN